MRVLGFVALVAAVLVLAPSSAPRSDDSPGEAMLIAVGDIASCESSGDEETAALVDGLAGTIAILGDTVYEQGSGGEFAQCFEPSWGRHKARTRPAVGNHEYRTPGAAGYFGYFGAAAGPPGGWYSYDLGAWHIVVLNSNCVEAGGCEQGSPQEEWLRADLARSSARCTLAYMHHPRFSSGSHGGDPAVQALWRTLAAARADVLLAGHDHHYERFAPRGPAGRRRTRGLRQFVVGTGGRGLNPTVRRAHGSELRDTGRLGVLVLRLGASRYSWRFMTTPDGNVRDAGSTSCH